MANKATKKATALPIKKAERYGVDWRIISYPFCSIPYVFLSFKKREYSVAAAIVGTARKNENSAALYEVTMTDKSFK